MGHTVVITGANRGIGLALACYYQQQGADVIVVCRQSSEKLEALGVEVITEIDVANAADIKRLQQRLAQRNIDILINNAGILRGTSLNNLDYDAIQQQFNVNSVAPLRVSEALLPNLTAGSKIALITSRMGSIEDNTSGGSYGYRMSKAALNAAGASLAYDLKPHGIAVAILHPGYVQTDMVNNHGDIPASVAAERLAQRIAELDLHNTGTFWHSNGQILPW